MQEMFFLYLKKMLNNKTIAVIVPCYNEVTQIKAVLETIPNFVDRIIVINDCSTDNTENVVKDYISNFSKKNIKISPLINDIKPNKFNRADVLAKEIQKNEEEKYVYSTTFNSNDNDRVVLINHKSNSGKGAGVAIYKWARDHGIDCTATMDGDGQMDPNELESICSPVVNENIDYVKGIVDTSPSAGNSKIRRVIYTLILTAHSVTGKYRIHKQASPQLVIKR